MATNATLWNDGTRNTLLSLLTWKLFELIKLCSNKAENEVAYKRFDRQMIFQDGASFKLN